jgi:hypothetical protein
MRLYRKLIRFWLGLKALGLAVIIVAFLVSISKGQTDINRARLVATVLGTSSLGVAAGIAWWTLKNGKPSGRSWAIIASTSALAPSTLFLILSPGHYPVSIFGGGILGVAGLVAFAAKDSARDVDDTLASKKPRIAADGTSKFKDYLAQAISMGIIWLAFQFWNQWAAFHRLARPGLLLYLVQLNVAVLLTTLFHEFGHLVAGWASGKMLRLFQVGPFRWAVRHGEWKFEFRLRKFYAGGVAMVAPDLRDVRSRQAFLLLGGPVASLVAGSLFVVATLTAIGHAWAPYWSALSTLATLSLAGFVVNLIPLKPDSQYSDGAQLYQVVTNGPWARVHLAFAMVTTSAVTSVRPRDFDVNVIHEAADFVPHGERGLLLRLFACKHYIDDHQIPEALASMQEAEALYEECKFERPRDICAEFAFVNAFYKRDLAAAELWWQRIERLGAIEPDADYWRAKAGLLWLKGELHEALDAWRLGNALAEELPATGMYDYTRSGFANLRKALDASMRMAALSQVAVIKSRETPVAVEV